MPKVKDKVPTKAQAEVLEELDSRGPRRFMGWVKSPMVCVQNGWAEILGEPGADSYRAGITPAGRAALSAYHHKRKEDGHV